MSGGRGGGEDVLRRTKGGGVQRTAARSRGCLLSGRFQPLAAAHAAARQGLNYTRHPVGQWGGLVWVEQELVRCLKKRGEEYQEAVMMPPTVAELAENDGGSLDMDSNVDRGGEACTSEDAPLEPASLDAAPTAPAAAPLKVLSNTSEDAAVAGNERDMSSGALSGDTHGVAAIAGVATAQAYKMKMAPTNAAAHLDVSAAKEGDKKSKQVHERWTEAEEKTFYGALKEAGSNFDKIADIMATRSKIQVRAFYNNEVKRINSVLAPLGVQVDPSDTEEVHTAMHSWHLMKDRLGPGGSFQELCKRPSQDRNLFAWELKNELDQTVWAAGKKEAKLKSLGLLPEVVAAAGG
eukprot:CAMPEP_0197614314 /NCGR_PEP_ID=MMETSP1326-20131121/59461_1 /TAXON_ID=1155430 /ORGANISM="Genus nov. species nov., Strain RCC2288" /LENGTH=349 /DNA_ID=CAMNT_0043183185 /DNA_START=505 /DNA_END=1552 /DNA_ORIENTATION=+